MMGWRKGSKGGRKVEKGSRTSLSVGFTERGIEGEIREGGRSGSRADGSWEGEGGENKGPLVGYVPGYGRGCRRRGGGSIQFGTYNIRNG